MSGMVVQDHLITIEYTRTLMYGKCIGDSIKTTGPILAQWRLMHLPRGTNSEIGKNH